MQDVGWSLGSSSSGAGEERFQMSRSWQTSELAIETLHLTGHEWKRGEKTVTLLSTL